jgi:ribonuclease P protein subunit POP4
MTPVTQSNIASHELIGAHVFVLRSQTLGDVKIEGDVVNETRNMIYVSNNQKIRAVPKDGTLFCFTFPSGLSVEIEGKRIVGRPVDRIKKRRRR